MKQAFFNYRIVTFCLLWCCAILCGRALAQNAPVQVDVIYPEQQTHFRAINLTGSVEAKQHAQLSTLEAGLVSSLVVEVGDRVERGQTLLTLDSELADLALDAAQASLEAAKVNLAEAQRLYNEVLALSEQQVVAQTLIAERAAFLASAQASLAQEQANFKLQQALVDRHTLTAPFAGVIAMRNVDMGEWVTQQTQVFELVNTSDLRLSISVPQEYYGYLSRAENLEVAVRPDATGQSINAKVDRIVPVTSANSRAFIAQVDLPSDKGLIAGMSSRASINIPNSQSSSVLLPRSAVKQHPDGGSSVFIAENGKAVRIVTPYQNMPNGMISIANQDTGKAYIVSGVELLKDGDAVMPNEVQIGLNL
ncbi:efflux RND transporter periplasmic adaptor subunit [Ningiella sp. W23]|uniref:efflux RND transporter periplasmic adaptor subunit n=1 Tax=Ningiella sp. W23 TaxID=3023715 RepID=UPI0037582879